jgi:hypothetical protein
VTGRRPGTSLLLFVLVLVLVFVLGSRKSQNEKEKENEKENDQVLKSPRTTDAIPSAPPEISS